MKKLKTILTAKKRQILIHDPLEALIARMSDPEDSLYDRSVAEIQLEKNEDTKPQ